MRRVLDLWALATDRTAILGVALALLAGLGVARLSLRTDIGVLSADPNSAARTLALVGDEFASTDDPVLLIEAGDGVTEARLDAITSAIATAIDADPALERLGVRLDARRATAARTERWVAETLAPRLIHFLDEEQRAALADRLSASGARAQIDRTVDALLAPGPAGDAFAARAGEDPLQLFDFGVPILERMDARDLAEPPPGVRVLRLDAAAPASDPDAAEAVSRSIEAVIDNVDTAGATVRLTGAHAIAAFSRRVIQREMFQGMTLSAVVIAALHWMIFRSPAALAIAIVPATLAILTAFGLLGWTVGSTSHLGALGAAMLVGLAIDYAIHGLAAWPPRPRARANRRAQLLRWSRDLRPGLRLTCATSAVAFGAIAIAGIPAARDFGLVGALGILAAAPLTLALLPAMLRRLPAAPTPARLNAARLTRCILARPRAVLVVALGGWIALAVAGVLTGRMGGADHRVEAMHPAPNPPLDAQLDLERRLGRQGETIVVLIDDTDPTRLAARLRAADAALRSDACAALGVDRVVSLAPLVPPPRDEQAPADALDRLTPEQVRTTVRDAIASSPLRVDRFAEYPARVAELLDPPARLTLSDLASDSPFASTLVSARGDTLRTLMIVRLDRLLLDSADRAAVIDGLRDALADVPTARLAAFVAVAVDLEREGARELPLILAVAGVGIIAIVLTAVRPLGLGLATLLPASMALVATVAGMALIGPGWNVISVGAPALVLGLGVDDALFLAAAVRRHGPDRTLADALAPTVFAITVTTLTTIVAFGSLSFSSTPGIATLGVAAALGATAALLCTLCIQMPIFAIRQARHAHR